MKKIYIILLCILVSAAAIAMYSQERDIAGYPVPPQNDNSLFYIQRSKNKNAIVYDANVKPDGSLDKDSPVNIYWIRYSSDSTMEPLTFIQQKFAYGVKATPYPGKPGQYILVFNSYSKKQIYLLRKQDGKHFAAYTMINGHYAELKRVFIRITGGTFWIPNIEYIDIIGNDMATQRVVSEHFKPAQ